MRAFIWLLLIVFIVPLGSCEEKGEDEKLVWNKEWVFCARQEYEEIDTQCVAVKGICEWKSVNYKYFIEVQEYYKQQGNKVECPAIPKHRQASQRPECVKGICTFKEDKK